jgi:manganese/iron transport system substrate-binding protein
LHRRTAAILVGLALSGLLCVTDLVGEERLHVVATTTIVGDVVSRVGGGHIAVTVLIPVNADPHAFEATPRDLVAIAEADIVFINGADLEIDLQPMLENATGPVIAVSEGISLRSFGEHPHGGVDPHVWFDPTLVTFWVDNIHQSLAELDPAHATDYKASADVYKAELDALDTWIEEQVSLLPIEERKLVTDHAVLGYFAARYGFEQIDTVLPGFSTLAEPSAAELARLEDAIRDYDVPAIFVGTTVNPRLVEQVARDTGTRLIALYTGSLGEPGGPADTYIALMTYDVTAIVEALGKRE